MAKTNLSMRSFAAVAAAAVLTPLTGCDSAPEPAPTVNSLPAVRTGLPEGPSSIAATPQTAAAFDFDTGNSGIEVIIPAVIPVLLSNVAPGDAPIVLRFTTLITNSWFDATAPYHPTAVGVYSDLGRRPASESLTNANMNTAMFYASYRVLLSLAPQNAAEWRAVLESVGLDPDDDHEGTDDPIGIGNAAGNAVVAARENDGMNQLGNEDGEIYNLRPFSDYTDYRPRNTAYRLRNRRRWQPRIVQNRYGITRVQAFVTPQYALVEPYSYDDPQDFGVPVPWKSYALGFFGNIAYRNQANEVLDVSANLTDEQKLAAELFEDKIQGLGFSALFASQTNNLSLLEFVQYDFLTNLAAFDVGIIIWQEKRQWDAVRPFSAIRWIHGDDEVTAWGGPGQGTVDDIPADEWKEYLNVADHPEYPSASTAFCAAHSEASRLFLGSDQLEWTIPYAAGSSIVEPGVTPAADTELHFETWTQFETDCGFSRLWAGVHFEDAILASFPVGHEVANEAYDFLQAHIDGDV